MGGSPFLLPETREGVMEQAPSTDFSTRVDERVTQVRNEAVRTATRTLVSGMEGRVQIASQALLASVLYQARLMGVRV